MRKILMAVMAGMLMLTLMGCQSATTEITTSTIEVHKDGSILGVIVDSFEEEYYDTEELKEMALTEISEYNASVGAERVKLAGIELIESSVRVSIKYDSAEDYASFNDVTLFYGTVSELKETGLAVGSELAENMSEKHVVVFDEPVSIKVPSTIMDASANLAVTENKKVMMAQSEAEELHYVVFK